MINKRIQLDVTYSNIHIIAISGVPRWRWGWLAHRRHFQRGGGTLQKGAAKKVTFTVNDVKKLNSQSTTKQKVVENVGSWKKGRITSKEGEKGKKFG